MFLKGLCWSIATIARKDTWKFNFYSRHFVLKSLTDFWIGSEKRILHFTFTVIICPATGHGDLKFITDSLPFFGLNQTYLIAKCEASMMWGDAMPHEMNKVIKSFSSTPLKNTRGFEIRFTISDIASVCLFFTIDKGNLCLFETYV